MFRNAHNVAARSVAGRDDPWLQSRNSLMDCWIGQFSLSAVMLISATMRSLSGLLSWQAEWNYLPIFFYRYPFRRPFSEPVRNEEFDDLRNKSPYL